MKIDPSVTSCNIPVHMQCPCGLVKAMVNITNGKSGKVKFTSVPAFAFAVDVQLTTKSYSEVTVDIGFGGTFYTMISDKELGFDARKCDQSDLMAAGKEILEICRATLTLHHPEDNNLAFLYGVIITDGNDLDQNEPTRNVCCFGDGQVMSA